MARSELDPRTVARVIAAYGFDAVRGRSASGSGAAPAHRLAGLHLEGVDADKRTVARKAAGGIPPGSPPTTTATPFDFAMGALFDWSRNGGQASFEAALEIMGGIVHTPRDQDDIAAGIASLLRLTVQAELEDPDARFLTGFAVQDLALERVRGEEFRRAVDPAGPSEGTDESLAWAGWLVRQRRQESRGTTESYEAVLTLALLLMRRRPKPGYTVGQIVRSAQSLWVGGIHRAFLEPELYPEYGRGVPSTGTAASTGLPVGDGQIERAMVDLIVGMTEESLFSANRRDLESVVIAEALRRYRDARAPVALEAVTEATGTGLGPVRERFPTDDALASACVRWLAGEWPGFDAFALQFRTSAAAGAVALLGWVSGVHREFPVLLGAAGFAPGDPAFDEVVQFVTTVFGRGAFGGGGAANPSDVKWARSCVEAAATGGDWQARIDSRPNRRPPD